jgi:hypothetical protein
MFIEHHGYLSGAPLGAQPVQSRKRFEQPLRTYGAPAVFINRFSINISLQRSEEDNGSYAVEKNAQA